MNKYLIMLCIAFTSSYALLSQTANPNASSNAKKIFLYLQSLNKNNSKRIISGHMTNSLLQPKASFDSSAQKIYNKTGKWIGILGIDYQRTPLGYPSGIAECNKLVIDYFKRGGLITVMNSFSNPWNSNGNSNDTTNRSRLLDIITPGNTAYQKFHVQLDSVAKGLAQLRDSSVTVLYRLFHEHNAPWFWWGSSSLTKPSKKDWDSVWIYIFNYFTYKKSLNNLLWVFSPSLKTSSASNPSFKPEDYYYPGNQFVDIVGLDVYCDTLDIPTYNSLKSFGKPLAICEFGMNQERAKSPFSYDYRILLEQIKNKYPEFVYWMSWNDFGGPKGNIYYGMTNQNFIDELLHDPWIINRNDINWNISTDILEKEMPSSCRLSQNYPNPFNPETVISYQLSAVSTVQLKVYDILGRQIAELVNEIQPAGNYKINFNTRQANAISLPSGVYFYMLRAGDLIQTKKMVLLK